MEDKNDLDSYLNLRPIALLTDVEAVGIHMANE